MLFLTLETFNKTGGIQSASRILAKALAELALAKGETFFMMSLCDSKNVGNNGYLDPKLFKGYNYQRFQFFLTAIYQGLSSKTIILSHINLVSIAYWVHLFTPGIRIILVAHGKEVWTELLPWKKRFMASKVEIWAVSRYTKDILINRQGVPANKIRILNNCLDPHFMVPSSFLKPAYLLERYGLSAKAPLIFSVGRINEHERNKGYDQVLDCLPELAAHFPDIKYILGGKVEEIEYCRILRKIKELNISPQVILPGFIPQDELPDHYLLSDIFIMPSSKEGFGLVFLEALACGRQVIAGNKDGSIDALRNGELGLLIDPASKEEIYNAISTGLQKTRNQTAKEIQQKTIKHFNFDAYKSRIYTLLGSSRFNQDGRFNLTAGQAYLILLNLLGCALLEFIQCSPLSFPK
jgi:phosphatidylinositol alpha-1,6-mannosyltransferase